MQAKKLLVILCVFIVALPGFAQPYLIANGGNADVSRNGNLQSSPLAPNNADVTRSRNLLTPQLMSQNADVSRQRNLQPLELGAPQTFQLTVEVADLSGLPLQGVAVRAANVTSATNSSGYVVLSLQYGTYNVTASMDPYYLPTSMMVDLYADEAIVLTLSPSTGSEFNVSITPPSATTSIGGIVTYAIAIDNYGETSDVFSLNVTGLDQSWYSLENNQVCLMAGETVGVSLILSVPEAISAVGTQSFNVSVYELLQVEKNVSAQLVVDLNPIMYGLTPNNDTTIGSTEILISWQTSSNASSEVYIKQVGDSTYNHVVDESGTSHFLYVYNLTRNTDYVWYAYSETTFGNVTSDLRTIHVSNGISFGQAVYTFNVERDYAQHGTVSVVNTDLKSHDLLLNASNSYDDLIVGFVGPGSIDQNVTLSPGETRNIDFYIYAQDAMQQNYTFTIQLTNLAENIVDYALVIVNVRQPNLNLTLTEVATDPWTLTKTLNVTNQGDPLTDLTIATSDELVGKVFFRPTVCHAYLTTGESLAFDVTPVLTANFTGYTGFIMAEGAGRTLVSLQVNFTLPLGSKVYQVAAPNLSIEFCKYYDTDESPNTNPNIDTPVESYTVNGTIIYFSQIIVDVFQNNAPVMGVNVSLTVWNDTWSTTYYAFSLFGGKAEFDLVGRAGTYSYQAKLVDYGLSTEVRTFSVSQNPAFAIHPGEISWMDISDGNTTFSNVSSGETLVLAQGPFTFRARQTGIDPNATFNLCLTADFDAYKRFFIPGVLQGDTLVFKTDTIPIGNYSAIVQTYSSSHGMAASIPVRISCTDWWSMYQDGNFTYNSPIPLNSTHMIRLTIDHMVSSRDFAAAFDIDNIGSNDTSYLFSFVVGSNATTSKQFQLTVTANQTVLYNATQSLSLEALKPYLLNVTVPIWSSSQLYDFNVTISSGSSTVYLDVHPAIDYSFNAFIWVGGGGPEGYGILKFLGLQNNAFASVLRCGAGVAINVAGIFIEGFDEADTFLELADIAGEAAVARDPSKILTGLIDWEIGYFTQKLIEAVTKSLLVKIGVKIVPLIGPVIGAIWDAMDCYNDWDRIWKLNNNGEGFIDSILGFWWHCTNHPIVSFNFDLSFPAVGGSEDQGGIDVYLAPRFLLPWGIDRYSPHDVSIWLNDWLVAQFRLAIPNGHYSLQANSSDLNLRAGSTAWNSVTIQTRYMNGGNYVVATGILLLILYKKVLASVVASSPEEAQSRIDQLMSTKYANKPDPAVYPEDIKTIDNPVEGMQTVNFTVWNFGATLAFQVPVQVFDGSSLIGDYVVTLGAFQNITLTAIWNATAGSHQIRVVVDPYNTMDEMDKQNNLAIKNIVVSSAPAHDVAVTDIASSKTVVGQGFSTSIDVTAANQGGYTETFNVTAYANVTAIQTETLTLTSQNSTTLTFTWNTTGFAYGNYTISAYAWPVSGETNTANNNFTGGAVTVTIPGDINGDFKVNLQDLVLLANAYGTTPASGGIPKAPHAWNPNADINGDGKVSLADLVIMANHYTILYSLPTDLAVDNVTLFKTVVGQGLSMNINVTVENQGFSMESFNLTVYANSTTIKTQQVTLTSGSSTTITYIWNTTGFAYGNYTISAYAWPVPGETDTANNNFTGGAVIVTIPGDVDGDGTVFLSDLTAMAAAWGSTPTSPNWNPNADIIGEGQVFLGSLGAMAAHWTERSP